MNKKTKQALSLILLFSLLLGASSVSLAEESFVPEKEITSLVEEGKIVDNQLLVVTNDEKVTKEVVDEQEEDQVVETIKTEDSAVMVVETAGDLGEKIKEYQEQPEVEIVQPNYIYTLQEDKSYDFLTKANDEYRAYQWYLDGDIYITGAWDFVKSNKNVRVAILDTGVEGNHPDLAANINFNLSYNVVTGRQEAVDNHGHGTHVAGIIAGVANNERGIAGTSYNAEIVSYKVTKPVSNSKDEEATSEDMLKGYKKAVEDQARIINISMGGYNPEPVLEKEINKAEEAGIVTICAGGNGDNLGNPFQTPVYPGDYEACISVVGTDANNVRGSNFDYNEYKDISAPGIDIFSTYIGGGYRKESGTSMAAPVVSGVAAMLLTVEPNLSVQQLKDILYATAKDLGAPGKDNYYGYGLINAKEAVRKAYTTKGELEEKSNQGNQLFNDVGNNDWYTKYVRYVSTREIMEGTTSGIFFSPAQMIPRAQVTEAIYKFERRPAVSYSARFPDVAKGIWYTDGIMWSSQNNVVTGYGNTGKFGPGDYVNREQLVTILYRYAKAKGVDVNDRKELTDFPDYKNVNDFAKVPMEWAVAKKIISGDKGKIKPQGNANRAEFATMMMRFLEYYKL